MNNNQMIIAESKIKLLISSMTAMRRTKDLDTISVTIKGKQVEPSCSEKVLGLFNNSMTWKEHIHGEKNKPKEERGSRPAE